MDKSFNQYEIDIESNSIFHGKSKNSSPYLFKNLPYPLAQNSVICQFPGLLDQREPNNVFPNLFRQENSIRARSNERREGSEGFKPVPAKHSESNTSKLVSYPKQAFYPPTNQSNELINMINLQTDRYPFPKNTAFLPSTKSSLPADDCNEISTHSKILVNPLTSQNSGKEVKMTDLIKKSFNKHEKTSFRLNKFNIFTSNINSSYLNDCPSANVKAKKTNGSRNKKISKGSKARPGRRGKSSGKGRKKITCNCKNSGCVKLYCECYRENGFCGSGCGCQDCKNISTNPDRARPSITARKSIGTFAFKFNRSELLRGREGFNMITKGCNCRKSQCLKKYCDCFNYGAFCKPDCCCVNCLNGKQVREAN